MASSKAGKLITGRTLKKYLAHYEAARAQSATR